jgi:hypothetical protein
MNIVLDIFHGSGSVIRPAILERRLTLVSLNVLPQVIVTTPERCLVLLLSMQPEVLAELGLIAFYEC